MNANAVLWHFVSGLGWWWWGIWVIVAFDNLRQLSHMGGAVSTTGRWARVLTWIGHLAMLFSPFMNSLGMIALPLILLSNNLYYRQLREACERAAPSPNQPYRSRNILGVLVEDK